MSVTTIVIFTNITGTTYSTVVEARMAFEKANPHIVNTFDAELSQSKTLGINTKFKKVIEGAGVKEIRTIAKGGDEIDDSWNSYLYEKHIQELTVDKTGFKITRTWTDERWAIVQSIPVPVVGNGWNRIEI